MKNSVYTGDFYKIGIGVFYTMIVVGVIVAIILYSGMKAPTTHFEDNKMEISSTGYNIEFKYSDIIKVDTIHSLPEILSRTNGFGAKPIFKGHFKMKGIEDALLFVDIETPPFIYIKLKEKSVFINYRDSNKTLVLFDKIKLKVSGIIFH